jgi:TetR/AcrR family transcriptional regulator, transcriptional repressor for nem operon
MARPRKFDADEVTAAAREVFWSHGYAATSIDDLCAATGLGRGSLYGAFDDKHTLFIKALDGYVTAVAEATHHDLREAQGTAMERVVAHIEHHVRAVVADTKRRGCMLAKSAAELSSTDRDVLQHTRHTLEMWRKDLTATLAEAQADGDLPADRDPEALAALLLTLVRGMESIRTQGAPPAVIKSAGELAIGLLLGTSSSH